MTLPKLITVRSFQSSIHNCTLYMADGPDGHLSLLARTTAEFAERDGEEYFLRTRTRDADGRWVIRREVQS